MAVTTVMVHASSTTTFVAKANNGIIWLDILGEDKAIAATIFVKDPSVVADLREALDDLAELVDEYVAAVAASAA